MSCSQGSRKFLLEGEYQAPGLGVCVSHQGYLKQFRKRADWGGHEQGEGVRQLFSLAGGSLVEG